MNGEQRSITLCLGMLFTALVAIAFLIGSCSIREDTIRNPANILEIKSAHILKSKCIDARGEWVHENYTDYCKFTK
jgi:hypothetical protein